MGIKINLVGQKFNQLTVVENVGQDIHRNTIYRCICDCGNETTASSTQLRRGTKKSCGCMHRGIQKGEKPRDLVGQHIGYVTVLEEAGTDMFSNGKQKLFKVECICGSTFIVPRRKLYNDTISCGCMTSQLKTKSLSEDLRGKIFGRLTVIKPDRINNGKYAWLCKCSCGNETVVSTYSLKKGITRSCGCLHQDVIRKDISGQKFGLLTVIDVAYTDKEYVYWNCVCDCGEHRIISGSSLRSGNTISCGCAKSKGERQIAMFLREHNISYQREKTFSQCKRYNLLPFDFWLQDYGICIEFDGLQHFEQSRWFGSDLEDLQYRDAIKTKYCEENDIILLRIPYWEKDNIESILMDWLFLYDGEEANSSTVDLSA